MKWLRYVLLVSVACLVWFLKATPALAGGEGEKTAASLEVLKDI